MRTAAYAVAWWLGLAVVAVSAWLLLVVLVHWLWGALAL